MSDWMSGKRVTEGPIVPVLLSFALPVLLQQLLQELFNITDCMVVGHFAGEYALAATGVAGLVLSILINFFIGFSSGISGIASRLFGARDDRALKRTVNALFRLVVITGICLSAVGFAAARTVLLLMHSPPEVMPQAAQYLRICVCGLAAQMVYNVGAAFLRAIGDTRTPLFFYLICALCNLLLDALLVIGLRMGVAGAAFATLASQWLLAMLITAHMTRLDTAFALNPFGEGLPLRAMGRILAIGIPSGMQALFTLPFYVVYALNQVFLGTLKGLGDTTWPMICTLVCYSLFRVLWCQLLIPVFHTMRVVYFCYDVSFFLMLGMRVPRYSRKIRGLRRI